MSRSARPPVGKTITRWLPRLERLEARETPAVSYNLSQVAAWNELGPNVIIDGQTRNISAPNPNGGGNVDNPVVGAVQALAAHPNDPTIMFAAGPNGGVWRTFNADEASPIWEPISDQVASLSVSDLAIDPDNPNRLLVGIGGTADGEELDGAVVRGDLVGVLLCENALSTNPASPPTWTALGNGIAGKNVVNVFLRAATGVAPNVVPGYMLVATDAGLYRSDDGGATFTNVFQTTVNNGVTYQTSTLSQGVYDLVENPRIRNQFYMATKPGAGFAREVWRTDDGGLSWGTVTDPQMQLNARTVNVQLSVRDASAFDNQIYVAVSNNQPLNNSDEQSTPGVGAQYGWPNHTGVLTSVVWSTNQGGDWTRMDAPRQLTDRWNLDDGDVFVSGGVVVVDTGPIPHRMQTGDLVYLRNVFDVPPATTPPTPPTEQFINGTNLGFYNITVISPTQFSLDGVSDPGVTLDSSNAYWNRVVGATPGENGEYLQIVASPTAQNLVYLGGDMSQFKFEDFAPGDNNSNGDPNSFTGSFWVGDRFEDPAPFGTNFTLKAFGYQWDTLTDRGTNGRTAPGGDTRDMLFDASGNLWVATGTGIYRRSLGTGDDWTTANGNIRVGQFWSASYDSLNGVLFGAMQDTGQTEQAASGSLAWNSLTGTAARNNLLDQEYAYATFVDNSQANNPNPALRRSVRYTLSSDFTNVRRRVFDRFNNLLSDSTLNFANSFTTTTPYSGLTNTDLSLTQDKSATITLALNNNNPTRGVYGLTSVYEDSDPNGETGFIVNNVTPAGMTGRVRAMSYGGRRLVNGVLTNFNQVLYIGTSTGQLFIRGEFGITYGASRAPSTGVITDIEVDPDDWRHAFVLQGGRVYETTTAGLGAAATPTTPAVPAWVDVSANLVTTPDATTGLPTSGGLTTEARTIALYDPNPGVPNVGGTGDVVLLAGGRGGVFRRTLSACGTTTAWAEYGSGLPNTVVQDLEVVGTRLVAGTYGRGVWTVNDVSPTLNNSIYLEITGDGADDTVRIEADPLDPNGVYIDDGLGNRQKFSFGQFDAIRVKTGGGKDTVIVDSNGPTAGGTVNFVNYPIEVDTGGDAGDQLVINADGATTNIRATIDGGVIGANAADTLFGGCGSVSFAGLGLGTLTLLSGAGDDTFVVASGPLPQSTVISSGAGNDNIYTLAPATATTGAVYVYDASGEDAVVVGVPALGAVVADTPNRRIAVGGLEVIYDTGIDSVLIDPAGGGASLAWYGSAANDTVYAMQDPAAPATWSQLLSTGQRIRFRGLAAVDVYTGGGVDAVVVDSNGGLTPGGTTKFVTYALGVHLGGDAGDLLVVNDIDITSDTHATLTPTSLGADSNQDNLFGGGYLTFSGLAAGGMQLFTGNGNDTLVVSAAAALTLQAYFGVGTDELWVAGTQGNDAVYVTNTTVQANALVVGTTGAERFRVYGGDGLDILGVAGSAGPDILGVYQTGPLNGVLTGFPLPANYEGVETLSLSGGGGTDSLYWVDYTFRTYGNPTAPDTGLVYRPTGPLSGQLGVNSGQVTTTQFSNIAGTFQVQGDPLGDGTRDVIAVYGLSDGDLGTPTGADAITATDAGVSIVNAALGGLRGISFGYSPTGLSSFATVFVRSGNEAGQGDHVSATTTTLTNLMVDGGNPTSSPGDFIAVTTQGQASSAFVNDPALGPPHTRITDRVSGGSVGHLNFEGSQATFISPITGGPVSSFNPPLARLFAVASDAGVPTQVKVFNADGSERFTFFPFGGYSGGARVAVGDVTGDGTYDIVVAAGPGAGPHVKVYDGASGAEVQSFFAYSPAFKGGVTVAVGYFNSDGYADILIGAGAGGGPHVKVIDVRTGAELQSFFAFAPNFTNGVTVAAGDFGGDGSADIVVGAGPGGGPHVKVFDGQTAAELHSFYAFAPNFAGGVNVAAGDITGDGRADVIVGAGVGGSAHVVAFDGVTGAGPIRSFFVNDPSIPGQPPIDVTSGVRVSTADLDGDGLAEVLTGRGPGSRPFAQFLRVSVNNGLGVVPTLDSLLAVNVFGDTYSGGIFVGG